MTSLLNVYVLPPFAVARLGASDTPVDAFDWVENPATHGAGKTVIRPAVSLRVLPDGSIQLYMPSVILFRDGPGQRIRPTAPFFELWGRFDDAADPQPLTETRLEQIGGSLARISWRVRAANLKAARRTKSPAVKRLTRSEIAAAAKPPSYSARRIEWEHRFAAGFSHRNYPRWSSSASFG